MNIKITSVHFDADKKLKDFIEAKIEKLMHFSDDIIKAEVFLRLSNNQTASNKIVEIRLYVPGNELFAKKESKSFEESTDSVYEALYRQIVKHKEKKRN